MRSTTAPLTGVLAPAGRLGRSQAAAVGGGGPAPLKLVVLPARPQAGEPVRLTVGPLPPALRSLTWSLGDARASSPTGGNAGQVEVVFPRPGIDRVVVRLNGASTAQPPPLFISVRGRPRPARPRAAPATKPDLRPTRAPRHLAHTAVDPAVGIADFHFTPAATTVHVGDTVTWANSGPSSHTATARDGSFATGTLARGASASHTFTHAGTFAYFCSIHPFMHGTITVLAASSTRSPAPTSAASPSASPRSSIPSPASPTASPTSAASGPTLPRTGMGLDPELAVGVALLGLGLLARRRTRPGTQSHGLDEPQGEAQQQGGSQ